MNMTYSNSQKRIMEAAKAIYVEKGYEGTSMNAIALKIGIRKPSLYAHFSSKEMLFKAIFTEIMQDHLRILNEMLEMLKGQSVKADLYHLIEKYTAYCSVSKDMDVWTRSYYFPPASLKEWLQNRTHSIEMIIRKKMVQLIKKGQQEGLIQEFHPVQVMNVFYHFMLGYVLSYTEYEFKTIESEIHFGFERIWKSIAVTEERED